MKRLLAGLILAWGLVACVAMPPDGGLHPHSRSLFLINWITANSDYVYNGEPLPDTIRNDKLTWKVSGRINVLGTYWGPTNTVYLVQSADAGVELHELVHYLQTLSGEYVEGETCPGMVETAAYHIEDAWLDHIGSDVPRSDPMRLMMMEAACMQGGNFTANGH